MYLRVYKSQHKYMVLMCSDLRRSSLRAGMYTPAYGGFFEIDLDKEEKKMVSLRTLVDGSVVESFGGGGRACITARAYPAGLVVEGSTQLYAFNNGTSTVGVSRLMAWSMRKARVNIKSKNK